MASAFSEAGIDYALERDPRNEARLDFYMPRFDVHVEVKRFHSDRIAEQMSRAENVIALQGEKAVRLFADLLLKKV